MTRWASLPFYSNWLESNLTSRSLRNWSTVTLLRLCLSLSTTATKDVLELSFLTGKGGYSWGRYLSTDLIGSTHTCSVGQSFGFKLRTHSDATGGVVFEIFPNTAAAASGLQVGMPQTVTPVIVS
jgi:hypothetical protein